MDFGRGRDGKHEGQTVLRQRLGEKKKGEKWEERMLRCSKVLNGAKEKVVKHEIRK